MPYEVNPETCEIIKSADGKLTLKSAGLLAYHLAGEKANHWLEVKYAAWVVYEQEAAKAAQGLT